MKISELIIHLEKLKKIHGDINTCNRESDEHWGSIDSHTTEDNVVFLEHAQPEGPKSGKSEQAIVFGR